MNVSVVFLSAFERFEGGFISLIDGALLGSQKYMKKAEPFTASKLFNEDVKAVTEASALRVSGWGNANVDGVSFNNSVRILTGRNGYTLEEKNGSRIKRLVSFSKRDLRIVKPVPKSLMESKRVVAISGNHMALLFDDLANEVL